MSGLINASVDTFVNLSNVPSMITDAFEEFVKNGDLIKEGSSYKFTSEAARKAVITSLKGKSDILGADYSKTAQTIEDAAQKMADEYNFGSLLSQMISE